MRRGRLRRAFAAAATVLVAAVAAGYAILATLDFEDLRGPIEAQVRAATGRELTIAGLIDLQISLSPAIALDDVSFENAAWGSRAAMVAVKRFEVEVALLPLLAGNVEVKRLVLVEPDILVETDAEGRGNWQLAHDGGADGVANGPDQVTRSLPIFAEVAARDGRLTYLDGRSGRKLQFDFALLEARSAGRGSPVEIALEGHYAGRPVRLAGRLGPIDRLLEDRNVDVDLAAELGGAKVTVAGALARPLAGAGIDLAIRAEGESLADLGAVTGNAWPPLGPYNLAVHLGEEAEGAYRLTGLALRFGGSDLAGNGRVTLTAARPSFEAELSGNALRLHDLATPRERDAAAPTQDSTQRLLFSETPLPLDALRFADGRIGLRLGELSLREGLALSDLNLEVSLVDGRLIVESFEAGIAGGTLSAAMTLDAAPEVPPVALDLSAKSIDYGRLLGDLGTHEGVSGRLDAEAQVEGAGASPRALAASLRGRIEIVGGEGRIESDLLRASGAGLVEMLSAWRAGEGDLRLNCVVARLSGRDGIFTGEAMLLDTAAVTVGGNGRVNLATETLDLKLTPQAKQTSLLSLAVPFVVHGPLTKPRVEPDPLGTAVGAARVAGLFLNPLAAGAAIVLDSQSAEQNPCVAALAGSATGAAEAPPAGSVLEQTGEGVGDVLRGVGEGLSKGVKGLFGD